MSVNDVELDGRSAPVLVKRSPGDRHEVCDALVNCLRMRLDTEQLNCQSMELIESLETNCSKQSEPLERRRAGPWPSLVDGRRMESKS